MSSSRKYTIQINHKSIAVKYIPSVRQPLQAVLSTYDSRHKCQPECDGTHNFERYRYRYFFPVPDIFDTDTDTFFRYQILTIPIPILFSGTRFCRYRYRYFFPVPKMHDTGSDTFNIYQDLLAKKFRKKHVCNLHSVHSSPND